MGHYYLFENSEEGRKLKNSLYYFSEFASKRKEFFSLCLEAYQNFEGLVDCFVFFTSRGTEKFYFLGPQFSKEIIFLFFFGKLLWDAREKLIPSLLKEKGLTDISLSDFVKKIYVSELQEDACRGNGILFDLFDFEIKEEVYRRAENFWKEDTEKAHSDSLCDLCYEYRERHFLHFSFFGTAEDDYFDIPSFLDNCCFVSYILEEERAYRINLAVLACFELDLRKTLRTLIVEASFKTIEELSKKEIFSSTDDARVFVFSREFSFWMDECPLISYGVSPAEVDDIFEELREFGFLREIDPDDYRLNCNGIFKDRPEFVYSCTEVTFNKQRNIIEVNSSPFPELSETLQKEFRDSLLEW